MGAIGVTPSSSIRGAGAGYSEQIERMRNKFPSFVPVQRAERLYWRGFLRPRAGPEYLVQIDLDPDGFALTWVLTPPLLRDAKLFRRERDHLHVYGNGSLCLYSPGDAGFAPGLLVAEAIVPRVIHWLELYEIWIRTGRWCAKQASPGIQRVRRARKAA